MTEDVEQNGAAQAFGELRAEVALMRRGVEGLSAERASAPDYGPTLQDLVTRQDNVAEILRRILANPMIKMTPAQFGVEMSQATEHLRTADRQAVVQAGAELQRATGRLDHLALRNRASGEQRRLTIYAGLAGAAAGMLLWSILPGLVARALPESWHVPEWMAARTMAMDGASAGQRLYMIARQRAPAAPNPAISSKPADRRSDASRSQARQPASRTGSRPRAHARRHP